MKTEIIFYLVAFYILAININTIIVTISDKYRAVKGKWRIKESTLFLLAVLGGALFEYLTMLIIRHKTKHKKFMIGLPIIFIIQILIIYIIIFKVA